ncbi:MAG: SurA N-terminal domain-containing protein, partial [Pseudomonadales bacterium]|nr:SurA N-terminal domain-containing protein [Pseudomonadales bacterium]
MLSISPLKKLINLTFITSLLMLSQGVTASSLDRILAVVNDDVILASDFTDSLNRASSQIRQQGAKLPSQQVLQSQVMEQMILRSIMLQMAAEQGIKVTDRQLNATIRRIAQNNGMSLAKFREALIAQGQDYIVTREKIKEDILIKQLQESNVNQRIQISNREVKNFLSS